MNHSVAQRTHRSLPVNKKRGLYGWVWFARLDSSSNCDMDVATDYSAKRLTPLGPP